MVRQRCRFDIRVLLALCLIFFLLLLLFLAFCLYVERKNVSTLVVSTKFTYVVG